MVFAVIMILTLVPISVFAGTTYDLVFDSGAQVLNADGASLSSFSLSNGSVTGDPVRPGKKYYVELPNSGSLITLSGGAVSYNDIYNADNFTFKLSRDQNGKHLESVKFVSKSLNGPRRDYIEIALKSATNVDEVNITFDVYFRARSSVSGKWASGDQVNLRFKLWMSNQSESGDADLEPGNGVVFEPVSNEDNSITWGGNRSVASLEFTASSEADKFYARLSTKANREISEEYGDPVNADLYFISFVGNPRIDSNSKAVLTIYNPWDEDNGYNGGYRVNPRECYIYLIDGDGYLQDVTDSFAYVNGDDTPEGVEGWQTKTRVLGSYVVSDTELDLENGDVVTPPAEDPIPSPEVPTAPRPSPPTGSHDFVALSLVLAAISGAAVFAVRKRR